MDELDLDALEAVADGATAGEWVCERGVDRDCPTWHVMIDDHGLLRTVCDTDEDIGKPDGPDATHIATFDPPTVKALIARVRRAEEPGFHEFVALCRRWLETYPPDIFDGSSGDKGPRFVVALRKALKCLS